MVNLRNVWDRISCLWTGFWVGALAAFSWSFSLIPAGDEAATKAFAARLLDVPLWCLLLASLPEILSLLMKGVKRTLSQRGAATEHGS